MYVRTHAVSLFYDLSMLLLQYRWSKLHSLLLMLLLLLQREIAFYELYTIDYDKIEGGRKHSLLPFYDKKKNSGNISLDPINSLFLYIHRRECTLYMRSAIY